MLEFLHHCLLQWLLLVCVLSSKYIKITVYTYFLKANVKIKGSSGFCGQHCKFTCICRKLEMLRPSSSHSPGIIFFLVKAKHKFTFYHWEFSMLFLLQSFYPSCALVLVIYQIQYYTVSTSSSKGWGSIKWSFILLTLNGCWWSMYFNLPLSFGVFPTLEPILK